MKFNFLHFYSHRNISFTVWEKIAKSKNVFWRERRFQYFVLFYQFVSCHISNEFLVQYSFFEARKEAGTHDRQRHWQSISEIHFRLDLREILVISYLYIRTWELIFEPICFEWREILSPWRFIKPLFKWNGREKKAVV